MTSGICPRVQAFRFFSPPSGANLWMTLAVRPGSLSRLASSIQRMEVSMSYDEDWFAWGVIAAVFVGTGAVFWLPAIAYAWF